MLLINDFLSLIYPRYCEACSKVLLKHEHLICNHCQITLPKSLYHLCSENELSKMFIGRVPLVHTMCLYLYEKSGRVQKLIHAIKYAEHKELAEYLGSNYADQQLKEHLQHRFDCIVPVPLHEKKLRQRGFNQSEHFAIGLSKGLGVPVNTSVLSRNSDTSTQTRKKKYERWENVSGIFSVSLTESVANQHILLVDDVITTGATIEAAWQALKEIPGIKLSVASLAFAKTN